MTREEILIHLKDILAEATETEDAVCYVTSEDAEALEAAIEALEQPERRTGKWIDKWHDDSRYCDQCGAVLEGDYWYWRNNYYCYHCGAKMEVEQDD